MKKILHLRDYSQTQCLFLSLSQKNYDSDPSLSFVSSSFKRYSKDIAVNVKESRHQLSHVDRVVECILHLVVLVEAEETPAREKAASARGASVWRMGRWHLQMFGDTYRRKCDTCGKKKQRELG